MKSDIRSYEDCLQLIEHFYTKLLKDPVIGHYFADLNLKEHIPRVADFWAFVLIDKAGYQGNMMTAHAKLPLNIEDFDRWLALFKTSVNELFHGEKSEMAIQRSEQIAWTMKSKLD